MTLPHQPYSNLVSTVIELHMKSFPPQFYHGTVQNFTIAYHRCPDHRSSTEGSITVSSIFLFTGWSLCFSKYCYRLLGHVFVLVWMSLLGISPSSVTEKPFYKSFFSSAEQTLCDLLRSLWYGELDNKATE